MKVFDNNEGKHAINHVRKSIEVQNLFAATLRNACYERQMFLTETFIIKFLLKIDHISGKSDYSECVSKLSKK